MSVRVRFAPAPSGELHVGSAHTALFNWLFARHEGGVFVLRIEDTDPQTARPELIDAIVDALAWLGIDHDEGAGVGGPHGPYRQSERRALHTEALMRLVDEGHVYRCYCTREDILARGTKTGYDRYCRTHGLDGRDPATPYALRFAVPQDEAVVVDDVIMGTVRTEFEALQDLVVARSDGSPTYLLAAAVDDLAMEITHVIRGSDLLPAAATQTLLRRALGAGPPVWAHIPLVLGPDKAKLSKRHGAVSVQSFRDDGILPEALVNYLALLGWSSPSLEEMLPVERIVAEFTLERVNPSPSVFAHEKLLWMNQEYVKRLPASDLEARIAALHPDIPGAVLRQALDLGLIQTRVQALGEVRQAMAYLYERPATDPASAERFLGTEEAGRTLTEAAARLGSLEPWTVDAIRDVISALVTDLGLHRRRGPQPIRVAISGTHVSLPLYESIFIIGRDETVARLRDAAGVPA